jgi:uncharacterized protein YkwD
MRALLVLCLSTVACAATTHEEVADEETAVEAVSGAYQSPLADVPCAGEDDDTRDARMAISRVRALAGLAPLRCDAAAEVAARGHCAYVVANGELTHVQQRGRKAFSGVSFTDRLAAASFGEDPGGEVLANITGSDAILGASGFINSVYHRALFLRSEMTSFGYGHLPGCATIYFGRDTRREEVTVVWPPNNAFNVPTTFYSSRETPNPIPGTTTVGSPISLIRSRALPALVATLTGPNGIVATRLITATNDPAKMVRVGEAHLVPLQPLAKRTTYRARFGELGETTFTTGE